MAIVYGIIGLIILGLIAAIITAKTK